MIKLSRIFTNNHILRVNVKQLASLIKMPSLSPTMSEGGIVEWHRKEGDKISAGDLVCDIQTDKAIVGLESEEDGILAKIIKPKDSQNIKIGEVIGVMADLDEDWQSIKIPTESKDEKKPPLEAITSKKSVDEKEKSDRSSEKMGPAVRRLLDTYGLESGKINHSGPHHMLIKSDILTFIDKEKLSPKIAATEKAVPSKQSKSTQIIQASYVDIPVSSMRQTIAKRMCLSKSTVPHFYTTGEASLDALLSIKNQLKKKGILVSVNDIIVKACSLALRLVPAVNSSMNADGTIKLNASVDISVAVATDGGLITPIVFEADKLSLADIGQVSRHLAEKARNNKLAPNEFMGGTFTISNLGSFGIKEFTAIINAPQAAILAVGGGIGQLKLDSNSNVAKQETRMRFTLCADARIVDEVSAAQFIHYVKSYLEHPTFLVGHAESVDEHDLSGVWVT